MEKSSLEIIKEYVENMRRDGDSNLVNILKQIYKAIEIEKLRNKDGGQVEPLVRQKPAEMTAHTLARVLLTCDDLPISTHANNHTYNSKCDSCSHGALKVGVLHTYNGDHIVIGNISKRNINKPNWYVKKMIYGDTAEELAQ